MSVPEVTAGAGEEEPNPLDSGGPYLVKLKGLPYDVTKTSIVEFLNDCSIKDGNDGVSILLGPDCRASGEALVALASHMDMVKALNHDRNHIGNRYVEVMYITQEQYDEDMKATSQAAASGDFIVRLRGLPYSAQVKDIMNLLHDCSIKTGEKGVRFCFSMEGRPSGEAYVELCSAEDVEKALGHSREHVGSRYVEIFRGLRTQMDWDLRSREEKLEGACVVKLRGLPYGCTTEQVSEFMSGINVAPGGITFKTNPDGSETGMAFVELGSKADVESALARNRNKIQHRYIEVFRSSQSEVRPFKSGRPTPYMRPGDGGYMGGGSFGRGGDKYGSGYERSYRGGGGRGRGSGRGGGYGYGGEDGAYYDNSGYFPAPAAAQAQYPTQGTDPNYVSYPQMQSSYASGAAVGSFAGNSGASNPSTDGTAALGGGAVASHSVRMRGLPWSAKDKDITDFFLPLVVAKVVMNYDHLGRPSGDAEVYFSTHEDARAAMQKNRQHIGHRYVELFLNSSPGGSQYGPQTADWNNSTMVQNPNGAVTGYDGTYVAQQTATVSYGQQQYQTSTTYGQSAGVTYQQTTAGVGGYNQVSGTQQQQQQQQQQQWGSSSY